VQARELVTLPGAPQIRSLVFRRFRGSSDYAYVLSVPEAHAIGQGIEYTNTRQEIESVFAHLTDCELTRDGLNHQRQSLVRGRG
jgi:hypothetical protein